MQISFIPIDYDYFDLDGRNYVRVIGRDDKGKRICIIDEFKANFYAILKENVSEKRIKELMSEIEKIEIENANRKTRVERIKIEEKNFLGKKKKALNIFVTNFKDCHAVADKLDYEEIEFRREYDISLITKYIIDKKLMPLQWHSIEGRIIDNNEYGGISKIDVELCIKAEKIERAEKSRKIEFKPKILAFDIEVSEFEISKGEILMISLCTGKFKRVLTWKKPKNEEKYENVEYYKDEAEMIEKFVEYVKKENIDLLVGYYSDGFDLPYLRARAEKNNIKLSLGLDNSQPSFARGRIPSASIFGIVHVDLFRFVQSVFSQYLQSETLGLNAVAFELIGEGKKDFEKKDGKNLKEQEWKDFFDYNLQDSILTYKLAEKLWNDMLEFSNIIQEPLFEITRSTMSGIVEDYILHNLNKYNEIAEKRPLHDEIEKRRQREKYEGAFVFQPKAGLYENIAVFDFTSYLPSIIVSYNLSKTSFLGNAKKRDALEVDIGKDNRKEHVYFSKKEAFFPLMLKEIIELRKKYKQEYKEKKDNMAKARSNAYKLLANASYGYQGFFGARYYCPEASASTTSISRGFIKKIIDETNQEGYKVIYADTDGVCFLLQEKTKQETLDMLKKLNSELPGIMELELEDFYKRGIWVTKRTGEFGAKKKYALITEEGKIKIRGFETVRRNWCNLARELQNKVLEKILKEGNEKEALEIVKKTINALKERKIEKKEIMMRTQLKKPINEYKSITPHIIAVGKMKESGKPVDVGMLVEFFIAETREKKALVREKVKLPEEKGEYNIKYYLEHQLIPAVENIFEVFGISIKEMVDGKKQMKLNGF